VEDARPVTQKLDPGGLLFAAIADAGHGEFLSEVPKIQPRAYFPSQASLKGTPTDSELKFHCKVKEEIYEADETRIKHQ